MKTAIVMNPPAFDPADWPESPRPPYLYRGLRDGFAPVIEIVQPGDEKYIIILGTKIPAVNIQIETPKQDPSYPVYFEATGETYHYVVSIWENRIEIEVCDRRPAKGRTTREVRSVMFPETEGQLRRAFETIVADCSS